MDNINPAAADAALALVQPTLDPLQARRMGFRAGVEGLPVTANPFTDPELSRRWEEDWHGAQDIDY